MTNLPKTQCAVQLVGPDRLVFNKSKEVFAPGRHQILCRVEVVGLCFSDLKLLKQFSSHVRKGKIVSGIDPEILKQIPSYAPGEAPTVPGHEAVVRIEAVGPGVEDFKPGQRYLAQVDYRQLRTAGSNAAFGYNFEGALQQYVLMDERVILSPQGDSMLIPVSEQLCGAAAALAEPWACVENAYNSKERQNLKPNGRMLLAADVEIGKETLGNLFARYGRPGRLTWVSRSQLPAELGVPTKKAESISELKDSHYDDVVYFGSCVQTVEGLFAKVASHGLLNIVLCGGRFGKKVATSVGRIHYGGIRIVGTVGFAPAESMEHIQPTGRIIPGSKINVIGAGGPMGMMHVIRNICEDAEGISIFAVEIDESRLARLTKIASPLAKKHHVQLKSYNPGSEKIKEAFDYTVVMAPVADLVAGAIGSCAPCGIINIFAGIPAEVTVGLDLDTYIEKQLYFVGTSGSCLEDMKKALAKVESGKLDTNACVGAVCGLDSAIKAMRAVESRSIAGKIMVYPACKGLGLIPLGKMKSKLPHVAEKLHNELWTKQAEDLIQRKS